MSARKSFHDFDRTHKKLLETVNEKAGIQEDLLFQQQMHKSELRQLEKKLRKMSEKEQYVLKRLKIDFPELDIQRVIGRGSCIGSWKHTPACVSISHLNLPILCYLSKVHLVSST